MPFEKYLYLVHKTRWILVPFCIYIFGAWLEGPPTRVLVHSKVFVLTLVLLSIYVSIYLVLKLPIYMKSIVVLNVLISVIFVVFVRYRYNGAIKEGTDIVFFFLLLLVLFQVIIWLRSLR